MLMKFLLTNSQGQASSSSYADDVMFSFFVSQSNSQQLDNKDLEQIDTNDLEEMDLNKKLALRNQGNRNRDVPRRIVPVKTPANALVVQDGIGGYDWSFQAEEGLTNFALMAHLSSGSSSSSSSDSELAEALREKDDLKLKLEKFETSSKNLTDLLNSQISVNNKTGVGFDSQMTKNELHDIHKNNSEVFESASDSSVNEIEEENKSKKEKDVRPSAPIIEEWESDSDDDYVIRPSFEKNKPSYAKINFVKSNKNTRKSVIEQHTNRQAENLRKIQTCFVCGSLNHLIKDCNFYENKMVGKSMLNNMGRVTGQREVRPVWNNAQRVNHQNKLTHPHPKRNFVPTVVLTKSGNVPVNTAKQRSSRAVVSNSTARYVNSAASRPTVNGAKPSSIVFHKSHSSVKRTIYQRTSPKNSDFKEKVNIAKVNNVTTTGTKTVVSVVQGHEKNVVKSSACWIWRPTGKVIDHISKDSGSFMPKRFDYVDPQGRLKHMTGNKSYLTDYQDIDGGFVAFAGSPKGGKITGKGKIRTGKFRLLKKKGKFWYTFVKENLSLIFFSVSQMCDKKNSILFTETECLVLSPDFKLLYESQVLLKVLRQNNMYSFDLKNVVPLGDLTCLFAKATIYESNLWHRRLDCENGTEFKNNDTNQFCGMKGIKREFSVAITPQQNGVAKKKNRTLIEADRTMLADSLLPTTFWAKAVNTACYVQNRVLVTKPHNKTPYELLLGRPPSISFMRPFGCPVTILNTLDPQGKFDGMADEGFLVGYSINSKAFRVFNSRTRKVEENLHINFLENKPNVAGSGPEWLFDIDSLEKAFDNEYILLPPMLSNSPLSSSTQSTDDKDADEVPDKGDDDKEGYSNSTNRDSTASPSISTTGPSINTASENINTDSPNINTASPIPNDSKADLNNLETTMNGSPIPITRYHKDHLKDQIIGDINSATQTSRMTKISKEHAMVYRNKKDERGIVVRNKARLVAQGYTQEEGIDYDEVFAPVARIEAIRLFLAYASFMGLIVYQMDVKSAFLYGTIEDEVYVCQPPGFEDPQFSKKVYKVKKALYGLHQAPRAWYKTLSTHLLENGFRRGTIDKTLFIKKDRGDILLVQVYVDDIIFGSTKKSLCDEFEQIMHKRFQISSMRELTFFLGLQVQHKGDEIFISQDKNMADILKKFDFVTVKTASTPIETNKALVKDEEAEDVDVHLYRLMIGSLMYLTASRPDIMFAVYDCARFQVTPKISHLHAVKRIFRYLKGQPKLGLWYPRDLPFDLEAFFDSDYASASLDRKSTTGGCQFLGKRLISWQCKKQTIVANSNTEAEYVAAANYYGQVLWIQNQMLDYGFNLMNTKIYIDNESTICIVKNSVFHSKTKHIEIRHHFIRESHKKKLIQVIKIHTDHNVADILTKAFDVSRFNFLIASIGMLNL
ncbi:putative ribonuclease H-like domain-containing protein [Tanacetum coccineum]|uniref:Ribonuclease H-like domain-containing protein n=1 Tax=Tanacetum coccineum TaxID=301880 RepID=A0ABQ4XYA3_9ASTR